MLPYFKRTETWMDGASATRGGDGPIGVEWARVADPIYDAWIEAGTAAGYRIIADNSAGDTEGFAPQPVHDPQRPALVGIDRLSQAGAASQQPHLMTRVLAGKVLIEGQRAVGDRVDQRWRDRAGAARSAR